MHINNEQKFNSLIHCNSWSGVLASDVGGDFQKWANEYRLYIYYKSASHAYSRKMSFGKWSSIWLAYIYIIFMFYCCLLCWSKEMVLCSKRIGGIVILKIAVCDDSDTDVEVLESILDNFRQYAFTYEVYFTAEELLKYVKKHG